MITVVMILRVWAMYNRSRLILGTLLALYVLEIIPIVVTCAIYSNPSKLNGKQIRASQVCLVFDMMSLIVILLNRHVVTVVQVLNMSLCAPAPASPTLTDMDAIFQLILGAMMYMLVMFQFIKQSLQMYRARKQWQLNHYITMIFREGLLYFILYVPIFLPIPYISADKTYPTITRYNSALIFNISNVLFALGKSPSSGWQFYTLYIVEGVPVFVLIPRFIINMRQLYEHDLQGARRDDIDSGFGLGSLSARNAAGTMMFADNEQNEELEQGEDIQMEERGDQGMSGA